MATIRERSPNYPAHDVAAAVEFARAVYAKEKMGEVPAGIVVGALGHESMTGPARTKVASMRQYDLIEGRGEKLRLTDLAFRILHSPDPAEAAKAWVEAAYAPTLFAEIRSDKPDASDEAIEYWLRRERKFSADGARKAVKAYRDTAAAVDLAHESYNIEDAEQNKQGIVWDKPSPEKPPATAEKPSGVGTYNLTGLLLEGGTIANLSFSGQPLTREGIDMLMDYLKLTRRAVPPTPPPLPPPPPGPTSSEGEPTE